MTNEAAMGLDKKFITTYGLDPLPTNNTHIIMTTNLAHTQI